MSCVDRLEIPSYPALATQARIQGTITVSVVLTTDGRVERVDTEAASKYPQAKSLFGTPVWKAIREAKFRPDCSGKTIRLIFHFDLEGTSPIQRKGSVFFGYPNTFWIVAEAPLVQPEGNVDADALRSHTRILGRVVDPLGDPVRSQPVRLNAIQSTDAPASTRTDADGTFSFDATHDGSYELVFEAAGFSRLAIPANVRGASINIGTVTLKVAPIEGPIEVPTYTATVSQSLNNAAVSDTALQRIPTDATQTVPRFEQFSITGTAILQGTPADPRFETPGQRMYRTMIRLATEKGPNFAGHYTVAQWGCGTGCEQIAVVDSQTGRVFDGPFGNLPKASVYLGPNVEVDNTGLFFRRNSSLFVVAGCPNYKNCGSYYYEWTGTKFKLLRQIPMKPLLGSW